MFKKFIQITALLNFPIALGLVISELMAPQANSLVISIVLGSFLMLMGAALLWATANINDRAPIILWGGLVRLVGFIAVAYASSLGMAPKEFVFISAMDIVTAIVYIFGSVKASGLTFSAVFLGKSQ